MSKRETFKIIESCGRRWRIDKFNALTGSYVVYRILFQMLPGGLEQAQEIQGLNLPKGRGIMNRQDFAELQMDCLSVCSEIVQVGSTEAEIPIIRNEAFTRENIEDDTMLVMTLTLHALMFNVTSFFEGDALKDLVLSFQTSLPSSASSVKT
jgi:hypothetical protein